MSDLLYKRIKKLGACETIAKGYKGETMKGLWDRLNRKNDFFWLINALRDKGVLGQHPALQNDYFWRERVYNALYHADPHDMTRRTKDRHGRECVKAMQTLFTFRQISRALAKVKV